MDYVIKDRKKYGLAIKCVYVGEKGANRQKDRPNRQIENIYTHRQVVGQKINDFERNEPKQQYMPASLM